jgi:hypothetical protein
MTANNTGKNNETMNDSGVTASNQVPIRQPFAVESNYG